MTMEDVKSDWATEPIAIIGLSCKFAGDASNPAKLWDMLAEGRNAWSEIPSTRFNPKGVYHPDSERLSTSHVKGAHFIQEDVGLFDAPFFNYSAETAAALDPQYRIQLESTYEALENAGISMSQIAGSDTSVYAGIFTHDYHEGIIRDEDNLPRFLPIGTLSAMASNRISHFFDLRGASMTVDTGCSTGLVALHQAVLGLRTGEASMSIVSGANLMLTPDIFKVFSSLGMLGPDGKCYAFDARANGYGRGEGVGTVVIKRLRDAVAAGDPIRAVIRETFLNQDGKTETITSPSQSAQEALMRECYRRAGLSPQDTQYFEAHGTGTPTGDPIEARAIAAVFGGPERTEKLRIGSIKTNIGHTEAASGLAGLIKVVLALEKGQIPPSVNFDKPNPKLKLDEWGLKVATELEPWPASAAGEGDEFPRRASLNNFGYGGANSHVIIEDARMWNRPPPIQMDLGFHVGDRSEVLLFYGRDEQACQRMVANTKEYLQKRKRDEPDMTVKAVVTLMKSLCWTLSKRRTRFPWVSAHATPYSTDLEQVIRGLDVPQFKPVRLSSVAPRIGMVFTGQGAQWHAMGRELLAAFPIFRSTLFAAEGCLRGFGADWSLLEELMRDAATTRVHDTALSIPICVAVQIALVRLLRFWGITPTAVTSHSSGEIAAAYAVGALTLRQAMAAAYYRATMAADKTLMNGSGPKGAMVAVGVGHEAAQDFLDRITSSNGTAVVACVNSPSSVTIAGDEAAVLEVEQLARGDNVFARRLRVDTGYHSHHMLPIAESYRQALRAVLQEDTSKEHEDEKRLAALEVPAGVHWAEPYREALRDALAAEADTLSAQGSVAFSSAVTGGRISQLEELADPEHWVASLLQPVQFVDAFTDMVLGDMDESGTSVDFTLEIGPHTALGGPIKEILAEPEFEGLDVKYMGCLVRNEDSRDTMRAAALNLLRAGLPIKQANISFPWGKWPFDPRVRTDLPSYPWNHSTRHWSEARTNRAYRERDQQPHDFLGALEPGINPEAATWRQVVRVSENSWLRDHVVQGNILYPGAGFVCLAIEGMKQLTDIDFAKNPNKTGEVSGYRLRDVEVLQALIVPETAEGVEVHTVIRSVDSKTIGARGWKEFDVSSVSADSQWTQHAKGLITIEFDVAAPPPQTASFLTESGYTRRVDPEDMFANLRTKGLNHGPLFQNTTSIVQDGKSKEARCVTTIEVADLGRPGNHVLHPTTLDSVFISSYAALPGSGGNDDSPMVPRSIHKLWVSSVIATTAGHNFTCNTKLPHRDARSYEADILVLDEAEPVLELQGFVGQSLGRSASDSQDKQPWTKELCSEVTWAPDLALSLGLPGALPAVKNKLSPPKEMDPGDRDVLMGLRRVCVYFCHDAQLALTEDDVARLEPHFVKFYTWMQDTLELAASRGLGPDSDTWTSDEPEKRQKYIALAATQSVDGELICQLGPLLVPMLRGERAPLEAMMEGRLLYKYYANAFRMGPAFTQFTALLRAVAHKNPRARILEIGAGTGAATRHALTRLDADKEAGPPCETWHFTDISSGFFEAARAEFAAWGNLLEFDRLDIEQRPETQGFKLASYDIVVACQVLHATKSMARTMDHVHRLMKPGATLLLMETTQDQVDLQFIFGLLPGWWLSEEPERSSSPSLSVPLWDKVLKGAGFSGIDIELRDCETDDDMYSISNILSTAPARPFKLTANSVVVVTSAKAPPPAAWLQSLRESIAKVTEGALPAVQALEAAATAEAYSTKICVFVGEVDQPVLHTLDAAGLQGIKTMATGCKGLLWVTRGAAVECVKPELALAMGFLRVLRSEYVGRRFPILDLDPHTPVWSTPGITAIVHVLQACLGTPDDVYSITAEAAPVESEFAVRDGLILVPRVSKDEVRNKLLTPEAPDWSVPESIPEAPLFQDGRPLRLEVGIPGLLDTLAFDDDKEIESLIPSKTDDSHLTTAADDDIVEIQPHAYGLNFRDVMVAMGQLRERVMGLECAGIITHVGSEAAAQGFAVGDRVMALLLGPFASRARVSWHGVAHMPEGMSFDDAASLPMIFSTAYVALVDAAHLRTGQSVLIHAAAGGVGQAAIMLAKDYLGAEVYATVGSQEKRDLLTREYGIPPERIFNSRDASFAPAVLAATGGRGVDVVLNSLAGPLLQAGFDVLAPFGHFVEIGKRDLEGNSLLEMGTFSRVASFTALDMMTLLRERGPHAHRVLSEVARLAGQKTIGPIHPVTVFPMRQVARAFRLLQTGKHTGKVILSITPDEQVRVLPRAPTPKLRPDASYLLVGGVGGLGRSIAHWLVDHGARNLILLSRSAGAQNSGPFAAQLREAGCRVIAVSCDVADKADLNRALDSCASQLPSIRGVIQGAMVLQDSILEQMTLADWQTAIRPKIAGSWNLHERFSAPDSLDFFVLLSSLSCILGWASQANYAAGGSYQDALARARHAAHLPAVSIDIGSVKGVGYVAESRAVSDRIRKAAQSLVLPDEAVLGAIGAAILHPLTHPQILLGLNTGPGPHWDPASESQIGRDARFVPLKYRRPASAMAGGAQHGSTAAEGDRPLAARLQEASSHAEATRLVGDAIAAKLGDIFMIPTDDIDQAKPPSLYGVDSLVAVELRNMIMLQAAADVSIFSILQSASLAVLASDVVAKSAHVEMVA
ncbi:hypothetical protein B0T22DRAFT_299554 [Podospora appendiculata]|uniref:Polyketide synthase n=1 Tax=Podospora appendiculata TaxID=314037 RepID=A0AAE0WZU3_9PEZI|nr:hypothetical protein B0T22DRAFT_299554 [Podospora appendiculata]